jgi:hypothetical protein
MIKFVGLSDLEGIRNDLQALVFKIAMMRKADRRNNQQIKRLNRPRI